LFFLRWKLRWTKTGRLSNHLRGRKRGCELLTRWDDAGDDLSWQSDSPIRTSAGVRNKESLAFEGSDLPCFGAEVTRMSPRVRRPTGSFGTEKGHSGIGASDYLIAGPRLSSTADLLTTNVRPLPMFTKLNLLLASGGFARSRVGGGALRYRQPGRTDGVKKKVSRYAPRSGIRRSACLLRRLDDDHGVRGNDKACSTVEKPLPGQAFVAVPKQP